jgi:hypothetical protein
VPVAVKVAPSSAKPTDAKLKSTSETPKKLAHM